MPRSMRKGEPGSASNPLVIRMPRRRGVRLRQATWASPAREAHFMEVGRDRWLPVTMEPGDGNDRADAARFIWAHRRNPATRSTAWLVKNVPGVQMEYLPRKATNRA